MAFEAPTSSVAPSNGWLITRNHLVESICRHQASESIPVSNWDIKNCNHIVIYSSKKYPQSWKTSKRAATKSRLIPLYGGGHFYHCGMGQTQSPWKSSSSSPTVDGPAKSGKPVDRW